jgi:hypothetical protein
MQRPLEIPTVIRLLSVIQSPPNLRARPWPGDLEGDFHEWFDGGAIKHVTGWNEYHFVDGTLAVITGVLSLQVDARLPGGAYLSIREETEPPRYSPLGLQP